MSDGEVAYFGYPRAAEDGALRAVQAALNLVATVGVRMARPSADPRSGNFRRLRT